MKYSTLLMDADNTIFDFPLCERNALEATLTGSGLRFDQEVLRSFSEINDALWKKFEKKEIIGESIRFRRFSELIMKCFEGMGNAEVLSERYINELSAQGCLINGAEKALECLSEEYDIYVITNGFAKVQRGRFSASPVIQYIKKLYISDELGVNKPDKRFFELVLQDIPEKNKDRILVVGDSVTSDMQGGKNAGLTTCLYDRTGDTPCPEELCDHRIFELTDIFRIDQGEIC